MGYIATVTEQSPPEVHQVAKELEGLIEAPDSREAAADWPALLRYLESSAFDQVSQAREWRTEIKLARVKGQISKALFDNDRLLAQVRVWIEDARGEASLQAALLLECLYLLTQRVVVLTEAVDENFLTKNKIRFEKLDSPKDEDRMHLNHKDTEEIESQLKSLGYLG